MVLGVVLQERHQRRRGQFLPEGAGLRRIDAADWPVASVEEINNCLDTDQTMLENYNIKGSAMLFSNTFTWHSNFADKARNARDASDTRPFETTYRQTTSGAISAKFWNSGPGPDWKLGDHHVFNDRWLAEASTHTSATTSGSTSRRPPLGRAARRDNDGPLRTLIPAVGLLRPANSVDVTTNYFLPGTLGGDHSFKAGYR